MNQNINVFCSFEREIFPQAQKIPKPLSDRSKVGPFIGTTVCFITLRIHTVSWEGIDMAKYSNSHVERATDFCFFASQCTTESPNLNINPHIYYISLMSSAESESTNTDRSVVSFLYITQKSDIPFRYRRALFANDCSIHSRSSEIEQQFKAE